MSSGKPFDSPGELLGQLRRLADAVERLAGRPEEEPDWSRARALLWQHDAVGGHLRVLAQTRGIALEDLLGIDEQKRRLLTNTEQFVRGLPANNVMLWGARGTGKSSLVKALLPAFAERGLRMVEVEREHLEDLPAIADILNRRPERFILFCDDLSFDEGESAYKRLKAALDGTLRAQADNLLIYATSNRRHLLAEHMRENANAEWVDGEIHPGDTTEEKLSLSERFGISLSFYPFTQEQYLAVTAHWLRSLAPDRAPPAARWREQALRWALQRGSRSGRIAAQFARDWIGRERLRREGSGFNPAPPADAD